MVNCVILAGSSEKKLRDKHDKAFININTMPMIYYVVNALKSSNVIDKIAIVGNFNNVNEIDTDIDYIIEDKGSMFENALAGIKCFKDDERVLISTCDIPLLTGEAVRDFIEKSLASKADICYPVVKKETCEARFPDAKRTYAKLKEGLFTGGNLILINPKVLDRCIDKAKLMIERRKNPIKMGRVLGLIVLIKMLIGNLSIENAEKRVAKLLKLTPKAIISDYPEIGNDVDKPEDLEMVEKYLIEYIGNQH